MVTITAVIPKENCCLEVQLSNRNTFVLCFKNSLQTIRFGKLADQRVFETSTTNGTCIFWGGHIELSLSEAFQMLQK